MLLAASSGSAIGYVLIAALIVFWAAIIIWGRRAHTVCDVEVDNDMVVVTLMGPARALALRKRVAFPLESIVSVRSTPNIFSKQGSFSRRLGSLTIPTFFRVGSFRGLRDQGPSFWACFRGETAVTFELANYRYHYVVVDVEDPAATLGRLGNFGT